MRALQWRSLFVADNHNIAGTSSHIFSVPHGGWLRMTVIVGVSHPLLRCILSYYDFLLWPSSPPSTIRHPELQTAPAVCVMKDPPEQRNRPLVIEKPKSCYERKSQSIRPILRYRFFSHSTCIKVLPSRELSDTNAKALPITTDLYCSPWGSFIARLRCKHNSGWRLIVGNGHPLSLRSVILNCRERQLSA